MVASQTELAPSPNALSEVACLEAHWASHVAGGMRLQQMLEKVLLDTLGLGNQQVLAKLHGEKPDFGQFCDWILATVGMPDPALLARYHAWLLGDDPEAGARALPDRIAGMPDVLDEAALRHWDDHGYVVLHDAISADERAAVRALIWEEIGGDPHDPASWYAPRPDGIMITRFQHTALEAARRSPRIHKAFAQLWGTADLWVTIDRIGFNPPERPGHPFAGSDLHWDVSLTQPIPFGTQAVLYLDDTDADQGAFRCVPGFHRRIDGWLDGLGEADPRGSDLSAEQVHVAGKAGDLIIWRQDLPHGASPNRSNKPRLAQYLNFYSPDMVVRERWR
jgi:hypothetical protein